MAGRNDEGSEESLMCTCNMHGKRVAKNAGGAMEVIRHTGSSLT